MSGIVPEGACAQFPFIVAEGSQNVQRDGDVGQAL